jgi:hypothetical protein
VALAALSNGVLIPRKLAELGIAAKAACKIVGIPASRLNLCVSGIQDLSPADAQKLHGLCARLAEIQNSVPFPLNFGNADRWAAILEHMTRENVDVSALASAVDKVFNNFSQQLNQ